MIYDELVAERLFDPLEPEREAAPEREPDGEEE